MRRSNRARTRACAATADTPARPRRSAGVRQAEPVQHQRRGLVPRVVGAVAEADSRAPQTPRAGSMSCATVTARARRDGRARLRPACVAV